MSMENLSQFGNGGAKLNDRLPKALAELQGLTISGPLTGTTANTAIPVAEGIDVQDTVLKAVMFTAGVPSDITSTISITSEVASGTLTLASTTVAGDVVGVNGKNYTAVAGAPSPSNPVVVPGQFVDGVAIMALSGINQTNSILAMGVPQSLVLSMGYANSAAFVAALIAGGSQYIAAFSLANAINAFDNTVVATFSGNVVTIAYRSESTVGNADALVVTGANGHVTSSGSTLAGGAYGTQKGTITLAGVLVGDTVTVDGKVFTAVASSSLAFSAVATFTNGVAAIAATNTLTAGQIVQFSTTGTLPTNFAPATNYFVIATGLSGASFQVSSTLNGPAIVAGSAGSGVQTLVALASAPGGPLASGQFIGGMVTVQDLVNVGFSYGISSAILGVGNDVAAATILSLQINNTDGSRVTASNNVPTAFNLGDDELSWQNAGEVTNLITLVQAQALTNVIAVVADFDVSAALIPLASTNGGREALSGATLTAGTRGIKSTSVTTGNTILLFWFKKSRIVTQW